MAIILSIETSTALCSVVLAKDGKVIARQESEHPNVHAEKLAVFIHVIMEQAGIPFSALNAVAIGSGPGSYTGLRIGTSTAKGLCYGLEVPLISVSTLKAMALKAAQTYREDNLLYCPMIDARRLEVYTALFDASGNELEAVNAKILDENSYSEILERNNIAFFGDGMFKMKKLSSPDDKRKIWLEDITASAGNLVIPAEEAFRNKQFVDIAYYEPFYLKDFVVKKKIVK
jgi:tRNA threonylcarbamoyladenosine biosynthesis protein TsaB